MEVEKIRSAAGRLLEVREVLLEAGLAPNARFVREVEELQSNLELFAQLVARPAA